MGLAPVYDAKSIIDASAFLAGHPNGIQSMIRLTSASTNATVRCAFTFDERVRMCFSSMNFRISLLQVIGLYNFTFCAFSPPT